LPLLLLQVLGKQDGAAHLNGPAAWLYHRPVAAAGEARRDAPIVPSVRDATAPIAAASASAAAAAAATVAAAP